MNGSHTTGQASSMPKRAAISRRSSSVVTGVIRSTIEHGKATFASTQAPRPGSRRRAKAPNVRRAMSPFPWMLSHDMTVNGGTPRARRLASPSTTSPKTVRGTAPGSRSAATPGSVASNSPVTWLKL